MRKFILFFGIGALLIALAIQLRAELTSRAVEAPAVAIQSDASSPNAAPPTGPQVAANGDSLTHEALPAQLFFVRPQGARGELIAYDMVDGKSRYALPAGMLSADGKHYFAATLIGDDDTGLYTYEVNSGEEKLCAKLSGKWSLSTVSLDGHWVALTRIASDREVRAWAKANTWETDIQIVDTTQSKIARTLKLNGNFELDTISRSGDALFLIEHLPAVNPDHYVIRLYDLATDTLRRDPLIVKSTDEVMTGVAQQAVASPDGGLLFTLYLNTREHSAFIHTLNLVDKFTVCIDLPSGSGDLDALKQYTLARSPDGRIVYAINPALGIVAEIDVEALSVERTLRFDPAPGAQADMASDQRTQAIVSDDGQIIYVSNGRGLWRYETRARHMSGPYSLNAPSIGLGLNPAGKLLYVVGAEQLIGVFDVATGKQL